MIDKKNIKKANIIESLGQNELYATLKTKFPQTIDSDGAVNFDAIKMLLGIGVKENIKGYELNWIGKGLANALYNTPCDKELKFEPTKSKDTDTTQNVIIRGDNLDALKLLKSAYYEKIKLIYIDPPYNTKNDDFIYPDDFRRDFRQILLEIGLLTIETDENGNEVEVKSEVLNFFTNITSTKSHSGWLSFMLPRLKLARDLLREDGVIFISIDDNEQANSKILCDEIFGEENFVCNFCWQKNFAPKNDNKYISESIDYILCYSKNKDNFQRNLLPREDKHNRKYSNPDCDYRGDWTSGSMLVTTFSESSVFEIKAPNGKVHLPPQGRSWRYSKETLHKLLEDNRIWFGKDGNGVPRVKRFLIEIPNGIVPQNLLLYNDVGSSQDGNNNLKDIFKAQIFDFPKPIKLLKRILEISTNPNENDIILDFFAGSGTTAHAVMEQNAQDGGNRKFILVQLDEKINEKKNKTAFDFCKNELGSKIPVISDIAIERVKRAGEKIEAKTKNLDLGFCVYDMTSKEDIVQVGDELTLYQNPELGPQDRALNLALQSGKTLDVKFKEICKDKLYKSSNAYYAIGFDEEVLKILEDTIDELVYISGYNDIKLEDFLNLQTVLDQRLSIVY
ncbi:site-specific DNA-methyltransferase [Campylobacter fetus]|uniref:site-specific DNA-methyltransferase n=1 Tax=Campylobacter fetus TaxID=196 RepID=UPI000818BA1A|nr:site-specific DNA-methyltransferase [Campylobacter fetus]OCS04688.1 DNA methyltransferase [Campylobacter fetus subsp. testudinum]